MIEKQLKITKTSNIYCKSIIEQNELITRYL